MSVQYGQCNFDGVPVELESISRVRSLVSPFGPDTEGLFRKAEIGVLYCGFHTTKESRQESQPYVLASGAVLTWDGRLDNRDELIGYMPGQVSDRMTDVAIVAAAYGLWGTASFSKLIGDWALSLWIPTERSLVLAKDPIGIRPLYYSLTNSQASWSSVLDPLVLLADRSYALEEEYIAGYLGSFPAAHLTPYSGIYSVPPSCFVLLSRGQQTIQRYWDFDADKRIRYQTDREYEDQFLALFSQSVRCRLRSDSAILAELSGGMDSSSIVCVADTIIARNEAETPQLDTVSYFSDSEPNWNERPYFTKVEEKRGRTGCHIDALADSPKPEFVGSQFAATPSTSIGGSTTRELLAAFMREHGTRVLLSGVGGDETLGGVPTPVPEFQDLLAGMRLRTLGQQLTHWALALRKPWFQLLFQATREFFPISLLGVPEFKRPAPWIADSYVRRNRRALMGYEPRVKLCGAPPSFQHNLSTLDMLRRQLGCSAPSSHPLYEKRYPYLDRRLLEFLYAIPREQIVRPHQRRSLMRRALAGIVPEEILQRKRKASCARGPMSTVSITWARLSGTNSQMITADLGIIDPAPFLQFLRKTLRGESVPLVAVLRTLYVEDWLRNSLSGGTLAGRPSGWLTLQKTPTDQALS